MALWLLAALSAHQTRALLASDSLPAKWVSAFRFRLLLAVPLALFGVFAHFQIAVGDAVYTVIGIPFQYAGLDAHGRDFVSFLTPILLLANAYIGFHVPDMVLFVAFRVRGGQA